jgi:pilus assembly protein CpaC
VIQASALEQAQVLVIAEAPGQSTLHLWGDDGGQRALEIVVVPADTSRLQQDIESLLTDAPQLRTRLVGDKVVIEGANLTEEGSMRVAEIARRYPQVVNLVGRVGLERMITMDVRMVEIRRDALQNIGVQWNTTAKGPAVGVIGDLARSAAFEPGGAATGLDSMQVRPRVAPFSTAIGIASMLSSTLNLMVQSGDAVVLAQPRLACRSGGSAHFVAGGEMPIPYANGLGTVSVIFKEYGVKFDVNPVATASGMISARIATEVSSINYEVTVQNIPGLTKRRAETDVNLRENETLVIAGLLTQDMSRTLDKVPGLADLPVLGALFRSRQFQDQRTELVVFITPAIVKTPLPSAESAVSGAAEGSLEGSLDGSLQGSKTGASEKPDPVPWQRGLAGSRQDVEDARRRIAQPK